MCGLGVQSEVRALLAERAAQLETLLQEREQQGWTSFQLADRLLRRHLRSIRADWETYSDPARRDAALERFHEYAHQWN